MQFVRGLYSFCIPFRPAYYYCESKFVNKTNIDPNKILWKRSI